MSQNEFTIMLQAMLDRIKSIANLKRDVKAIEPKLPKVKLQGELDKAATQKDINSKIKSAKPQIKVDANTVQAEQKIEEIGKQKTEAVIQTKVDSSQAVSGIKEAQKETKTLWERVSSGISGINLVRMAVQRVTQAIREAIATAKELDAIKTNIQMVSGGSDSDVNAMMSSYNAMAKELSSTTKDVAEAANEFLRMGESVKNTNELIKSSQILSKVGMIDSADAAGYLISSLKGYKVAAEDSMDVVSKLTSVDLEAAVSAGGLAEAISRCSNIANNSAISMDRLIGYTATVGEVTQKSMSEVGNSFQALLSRMNNIKIGRFIDDETGESLSDTEKVLNKLGIQLRDTENTYRSFDDVLDDVGSRWKDFTKVEQNAISVAIAGTRQRENFEALMNNYGNALKYAETAANSAGSALERYGVYQDSIEAKTNELTAAMESLSTNIISEELYSGIIEATTGLVEFIDKANLLKGALAGLVAMGVSKAIVSMGAGFATAARSTAQLSAAMALFDKGRSEQNLLAIGAACKGLSNQQLKLILSSKTLKYEDRELILAGMGVAETEQKQMLTTLGFAAAEDKATASTFSLKGAFRSLKAVIATNPLGAIMTAVSVATMVFSGFNDEAEEARQKAKELGDGFRSAKSDIEGYKTKIEDLQKVIHDSGSSIGDVTEARKSLMAIQDELLKKFGAEKENIEIVTNAINKQSDALDLLTKKQYLQWKNDFNKKSFKTAVGDYFSSSNIADAFYKLGEFDFPGVWEALTRPTQSNIDKMASSMQHAYYKLEKTGNDTLDSLIAKAYNPGGDGSNFILRGNLNDVYETLLEIQELANDFNVSDSFETNATKLANSMDKTLKSYKESYDIYVLYEKILDSSKDNPYDEQFDLITKAKEKFDEASILGDTAKIKEAGDEYAQTLQSAIDLAEGNWDQDVADYFKSMYPELRQMFGEWKFNLNFEPNTDGLKDSVTNALDAIDGISDGNVSFSVEDIKNFNFKTAEQEQIDAYGELLNVAETYDLTIGQLIEKLRTMGLVQSESRQQLEGIFGKDNISQLSPEDLEIAYTIKDAGDMTFEQLRAEIKKVKENMNEPIALSAWLTSSQESLGSFQSSIISAADAYEKLMTGSYSSSDLLGSIQAINKAATEMGESIKWEEIGSLDELGDKMEEISKTYANSVLSGAGIDIDNDFRQMLANIIQEAYESEAALASLNTQIDSLQDSYKNLTDIIETYNQHSYVTFDQLQTLLSMEPQYLSCLIDENGQLRLNREAMQELAKQRLKDARAQIIAQAITELNELQFKKEKTAIDDAKMAIEDIDDTLTSYEERLLEFIPIGELTTEEFIKISNAINGAASNGVSDEDIDAALQNAEKKLKFLKDMWNGEIGSMFGGFASSEKASDTEKEFDWIEQAIENVRKEIQSLDEIANSSYATFSQKNAALAKEIEKVSEEIALQQKAYEEYMRKADAIGLGEDYKVIVRDGAINIENISDEDLQKKISDYQQWHEKAVAVSDAIKELNTDLKDLHVSAYELHTEDLKDRLDNGSLTEKQYLSELKAAYERFYGNLEEYAQQYHEAVLDCLKQEKEYLNTVAGAAVSLLDTEIDAVRDSADEQEEQLKKQIELLEEKKKPLQEELDALEEKARKEDLILNLQKAQYDLARAENQRTKLVYKDGQLVYTNDSKAARDAQKGLDDAKLEIQKQSIQDRLDGLDEEISRYNDLIDQINNAADNQINALEKVKNKWQEVIDQQEYAANISLLTGEFGTNAIEKLLSGNDDDLLAQWKNSYVNTLAGLDMETQGYIGNMTQQIASLYNIDLSVLQSQFQGVKDSVASLDNTIRDETDTAANAFDQHTDKLTNEMVPAIQGAATEMDTFNESAQIAESSIEKANATLSAFSETASKLPVDVFNSITQSVQSLSGALDRITHTASGALDHIANTAIGSTSTQLKDILSDANGIVDSIKHGSAYGDGTPGLAHDEENALRSEYGQPELTVYPDGTTEFTTEPVLSNLPKGTVVYNEEQTKELLNNKTDATGHAYAEGTAEGTIVTPDGIVLTPLQPGDEMYDMVQKWNVYLDSINHNVEKLAPNSMYDHNRQMHEIVNQINNVSNVVNNRNVQPVTVNQNITLNCPNVTNNSGVEYLQRQLNGLSLKARQEPLNNLT